MRHTNVEFKARSSNLDAARHALKRMGASGPTADHQVDTYFESPIGRLKLREGTVERALIYYSRPDDAGPKRSDVTLADPGEDTAGLKETLTKALGVRAIVEKRREIWWLDNVKVHLDQVEGLGTFVEVEAIARDGLDEPVLREQCESLLAALGVEPDDLVAGSYGDVVTG